ncbi:MAG TPA: hypothetical protein VFW27_33210 [Actinoplanes sp.]|nr:hypothetical protein [Actinoplanes sp.]
MGKLRDIVRGSWWGRILAEHDTEPTELAGGLMKVLLGLVLLTPLDTFGGARVYGMLSALSEPAWGAIMLLFGAAHLLALRSGRPSWRRTMCLAGFMIWFTWSVSFWLGNPSNTGGVVYALAALAQAWCYVRLSALKAGA